MVFLFSFLLASFQTSPPSPAYILSFILHMCPNRFSFLSMICCMMFLHRTLLRTSSFMIFCSHLILNILLKHFISRLAICLCFFFSAHVLLAYITTLITVAFNMFTLVPMLIYLLLQIFHTVP